jgi:hypothetical protein
LKRIYFHGMIGVAAMAAAVVMGYFILKHRKPAPPDAMRVQAEERQKKIEMWQNQSK